MGTSYDVDLVNLGLDLPQFGEAKNETAQHLDRSQAVPC